MSRLKFSCKISAGYSRGGYFHLPLLYFGFGRNGFGITILGIFFSISW